MTDAPPTKRPPNVFVFNPFAEGYLARGKAFTPVKHQWRLARDLANLPQFLGGPEDVVLVAERPSRAFLEELDQAGFAPPEFVELKGEAIDPESGLGKRPLGGLRPWAWGPDSAEVFAPVMANVAGAARAPGQYFNQDIARLYSKAWSAEFLARVLSGRAEEPWLCPGREAGVAVDSVSGAMAAIEAIRRRGHHKIVVKEALGVAGHNSIRLWEPELLETQLKWIASALKPGRQLVVEPWLERVLDFSVQLEMEADGLKLRGYTGLITDLKGQFQANWAAAGGISANTMVLGGAPGETVDRFHRLYEKIIGLLEGEFQRAGYLGPAGIDAFLYQPAEEGCRLKPIVEINPRYTMGRLTLELLKHTCPGSYGMFRLVSRAMARAEGFDTLAAWVRALRERHPLRLERGREVKIRAGALCLNDPARAESCLAVFQVSQTPGDLFGRGMRLKD